MVSQSSLPFYPKEANAATTQETDCFVSLYAGFIFKFIFIFLVGLEKICNGIPHICASDYDIARTKD